MRPKIVNILTHGPSYHYYQEKYEMQAYWDLPDGSWLGTDGEEFPDLLGKEIVDITDEFEYEVWQPDYRADKMYSAELKNNLVHRLFPALDLSKMVGLKRTHYMYSFEMERYLHELTQNRKVILNLNGGFTPANNRIIRGFKELPIVQTFRGIIYLPNTRIFKLRKNLLASLSYIQDHFKLKELIKHIDYVTYMNEVNLDKLEEIYDGPKDKLTSGVQFDFWHKLDRISCRKQKNLPLDKFIIFSSSRLIPLKQVDKLINILNDLDQKHDFLLIISGSGQSEYEKYLKQKAEKLIKKDKIRFVGYLFDQELREYYSASDLFINTSMSEGGPVSSMKAFATEIPVMSTDVGNTAEIMQKYRAGIVVPKYDYGAWKKELEQILNGKKVNLLDRSIALEHFEWKNIARNFIEVYKKAYEISNSNQLVVSQP